MPDTAGATTPLGQARSPLIVLSTFVLALIAVLAMHELAALIVPVVFGLLLALVAAPLVGSFERRGLSHRLALVATVLVVLAVVVISIAIVAYSIAQFVGQLPQYQTQLQDDLDRARQAFVDAGLAVTPDAVTSVVSPGALAQFIRPIASALSSVIVSVSIVFLTMIYAIVGGAGLRRRAERGFGSDHALLAGVETFGRDLRRYLIVRAELGIFAGVLVLIMLVVLGVPFPLLWAFLTFAASFIPNVGFLIALIPPTVLAFLEGGFWPAAIVVIGFTLINLAQDNLLQPVILGSELNLSPLVVFVAVIAWAWILGAAGALLAVPLTVGVVALMDASPWTRGAALLLRNNESPTGEQARL